MIKSAYIHIPFCKKICSYCDFCKVFYKENLVLQYLDVLEKQIKNEYEGDILSTIYIGGGTPSSLSTAALEKLFTILQVLQKGKNAEYTIECNIEDITEEKISIFKKYGINRISIGIQTFQLKYLTLLERNHTYQEVIEKINLLKQYGFFNINIDLMYAFNGQTIEEVKEDLHLFLTLDVPHISTYSLIIEPHTKLYIKEYENIEEDMDAEMYNFICNTLKQNYYEHYEVSNFAKKGYESRHNLTYWNHDFYYGFGAGTSGYIKDTRYENTRSVPTYIKDNTKKEEYLIDKKESIYEEIMLGFRKIKGISKRKFYDKYNQKLEHFESIKKLIQENKILENEEYIYINPKYVYVMNEFLVTILRDLEGVKYE
ncbi:MAG: radical SAM family heme chaperone HemW [Bacilli bacterium]|nr:radical SAM family heme chaperone HemW [Bacilli bacterium]